MSYSVSDYATMMADDVRMSTYIRACQRAIKPGAVVLDLGAGAGIFALIACQLGASRVYAIETGNGIALGRKLARANGCESRIEFHQARSVDLDLPERVDVIISDLRGKLPFHERHIETISDARHRFLCPRGQLLPQRDVLHAAVLEASDVYTACVHPWPASDFGLELSPLSSYLTETSSSPKVTAEQLLTGPSVWFEIDYATVEDPNASGDVSEAVLRDGVGHGILVWFDAWIDEIDRFSGGPDSEVKVYGQLFLPWTAPVELQEGDLVEIKISARLAGDRYYWNWSTQIESPNGAAKAQFRQTTFATESPSPRQLEDAAARIKAASRSRPFER